MTARWHSDTDLRPQSLRDALLTLLVCLLGAVLLLACFLIGDRQQCDRLTDAGSPNAATYCGEQR